MHFLRKSNASTSDYPQLHLFGCVYSDDRRRQTFFTQEYRSTATEMSENIQKMHEQNCKLKEQLGEVRKIINTILYQNDGQQHEKSLMELLEELLLMILAKAEENAHLKQKLDQINLQTVQKIQSSLSLFDSREKESRLSSQRNSYSPLEECNLNTVQQCPNNEEGKVLGSCQNSLKPKYWPKVLFSIGKEVKTIDQISSNKLVKKDSLHSYSKSSSQESSFKELMHLKQNRLSIDRSIYIQNDKDIDNPRFSVQYTSRDSSDTNTKKNIAAINNQLTPIKEERFSDKCSDITGSKVKYGVYLSNGERFTFQSTNTDPQSYSNSKHY